jgi:putative aldouronate transport system substrate-binding protein
MKSKLKVWINVMIIIMLVTVIAGCTKDTSDKPADNDKKATPSTETVAGFEYTGSGPITDKSVELSILATNAYSTNVDLSTAEIVQDIIKNAGVSVKWELLPPQNYKDAVSPRLAAGLDLPDIVYVPDQDQLMKYINGGLFIPIDELYEKYGVNLKKVYEKSPDLKASLTTPNGKMYYVPQQTLTKNYMPLFMVNMRWLDALGLKEPTTLDEFTDVLRKFKSGDPNKNGKQDELPLSIDPANMGMAFGPSFGMDLSSRFYADDTGKVHFGFYEPVYKEYLTYLNGLYKDGLLAADFASTTRDQITSRFSKDITGATFDFSWLMSMTLSPLFKDYDRNTPLIKGIVPLKGPHGDQFYVGRTPMSGIFGISKNSKNPELAFKFLDYAVSEEAQNYYTWGKEGVTYEVKDGIKQFTEKGKDNDFIQKLGIGPVNLPSSQSTAAADVQVAPWHSKLDKELEKYIRAPFPFVYALPDEADVEKQYMADITTYVDEMNIKFIMGKENLTKFDDYIKTLKGMNIEQVIKGKQAQYDRYLAATKK